MSTHESKYEIWRSDKNDQWYWHFKAGNGETIASGQAYASRANCIKAIALLQRSMKHKIYSLSAPKRDKKSIGRK